MHMMMSTNPLLLLKMSRHVLLLLPLPPMMYFRFGVGTGRSSVSFCCFSRARKQQGVELTNRSAAIMRNGDSEVINGTRRVEATAAPTVIISEGATSANDPSGSTLGSVDLNQRRY